LPFENDVDIASLGKYVGSHINSPTWMYMENERESTNNLACTVEIHRWNSSVDKNYDMRFRLNAQCASAAKGMDFSKHLFFCRI